MMKRKIVSSLFIILLVFAFSGCNNTKENNMNNRYNKTDNSNEVVNSVKAQINEKEYIIDLEDNETAKSFINMLPQELIMSDLNDNEKYVYLDNTLPTNPINPKHINKGDVMLYQNNCFVIFYKSFDTSYSYTKIGHINDLPDLGNENINIKIKL